MVFEVSILRTEVQSYRRAFQAVFTLKAPRLCAAADRLPRSYFSFQQLLSHSDLKFAVRTRSKISGSRPRGERRPLWR